MGSINLKLLSEHIQTMTQHAESTYPEECCGIIFGHMGNEGKTVVKVMPTDNAWSTQAGDFSQDDQNYSERRRYAIAPEVMLKAQKEARDSGVNIIGIYHSHPDYPATPSEFDRVYAWQEYSYIIVSVQNGKTADIKSWCLDNNHEFQEEKIQQGVRIQNSEVRINPTLELDTKEN
ncbi:M67 family metallopeptidase [Aetokthonos hydrillicola Thurmond2011]|uniref:M67 family metallopeptidase n=1 Tax=Aetokthonos hydrillicola Thurmond2011 TaxID=2712845 RepID=A0AAP5MCG7_9CYAN|nr:M67 family metallopeptidase [Aetokthonos hydrillicola]MBO3462440.1 M67 family metallopeptidase [Aetokthonos hydrillicola CCALA 1050]MBW4590933.1 M67 family metallopeptidase [Aetokthonos hydrillicola CCALA 1050]MDR9899177.1 M67 family metallopeptidase [Aetokthonos hydrillicola Thurmond2011]